MAHPTGNALRAMLERDSTAFRFIFVLCFIVLFATALVAQLLTWQWRSWLPGAEAEKSLVGGVSAAVYTLMSYLN